jgi:hypothetical protein
MAVITPPRRSYARFGALDILKTMRQHFVAFEVLHSAFLARQRAAARCRVVIYLPTPPLP